MYEYWVKDCLGNTRVAFKESSGSFTVDVLQRNDYYPFGKTKARGSTSSSKTSYLYNGKEEQEGFDVLDYGARFYDPIIGRWHQGDPLAEQFHDQSPYKYAGNNPINMTDPDGMGEIYGQASGNFGNVSTQFNASPLSYKGESYADMDELQEANPGTVFAMDAKTGNYVGFDDKDKPGKKPAPAKDTNQGGKPLTHDQELAKYGQIIGFGNASISGSYGAGVAYEYGTIETDKGWLQRYQTIYSVAGAGISGSYTGGVIIAIGNNKPTFSDWRGLATGGSVSYLFFGTAAAKSNTYYAIGASLGLGYGLKGNWNGTFSYAWTFLIGNPYPRPPVDLSRSYINTQTYFGGQ